MSEPTLITDGVVRLEADGHVAIITLNRPEARNAVNHELAVGLGAALERFAADPELRVAVLRGEGRAFCAGQDLKAFASGEVVGLDDHPEWGFAGIVRHRVDKPIIAAVHGFAFGGGFEIALSCDLIVLGRSAQLGFPEVTLGLFAAAGGVPRIAQHMPPKVAARHVLTGAPITADEALRWGVVSELADDDGVTERAVELARAIAANGPLGVAVSKRILRDLGTESTWTDETWARIQADLDAVFGSDEGREGVAAFLEKRRPTWAD